MKWILFSVCLLIAACAQKPSAPDAPIKFMVGADKLPNKGGIVHLYPKDVVQVTQSENDGAQALKIQVTPMKAKIIERMTFENVGADMKIFVQGKEVSSARIVEGIKGDTLMLRLPNLSAHEVSTLSKQLRSE